MKNKIEIFEIILRSVRSLFMSFAIVVLLASFFSFGGGDAVHAMSVSYIWQLFAICFGVNFTQFFLSFINFNSFALATSAYFADTLAVVYLLSWLFGFLDGTFKIFLMVFSVSDPTETVFACQKSLAVKRIHHGIEIGTCGNIDYGFLFFANIYVR